MVFHFYTCIPFFIKSHILCCLLSSSGPSFKCALRESGCRIGYEPTKNESRSLSAVEIQGHQRGGFCITGSISSSSSLTFKCALRESGYKIVTSRRKTSRDHFRRLKSRDTNVEVSVLSQLSAMMSCETLITTTTSLRSYEM